MNESITIFDDLITQLSILPQISIGRKDTNDIILNSPNISGKHAILIKCSENSYIIEDCDSKNGVFYNNIRIKRKLIDIFDAIQLADNSYILNDLLKQKREVKKEEVVVKKDPLDFTVEFENLQKVFDEYPQLKKNVRNREKLIRTGSILLSSTMSVSMILISGGSAAVPIALHVLSGAGLSTLIPTLTSSLLSTDEKLELIEKEYREKYRCPNPDCRDPFGLREWAILEKEKSCRKCKAIWVK